METNTANYELTMVLLAYYNLNTKGLVQNLTEQEVPRGPQPDKTILCPGGGRLKSTELVDGTGSRLTGQ